MKRREFLHGLGVIAASGLPAGAASLTPRADANVETAIDTKDKTGREPGASTNSWHSESFTNAARVRSGMALGGIGAGSVELRKDGRFYNWAIFNNLPKETGPAFRLTDEDLEDPLASVLFFKVRYQVEGEQPQMRLLQLSNDLNEGGITGICYVFPWMQAVDEIRYGARFPFARLRYTAQDMPFDLELEAWSPFIPHDLKHSSMPHIYFDFTLVPKGNKRVDVMLVMCARNTVGYDAPDRFYTTDIHEAKDRKTVRMSCEGMDTTASTWGEIAISSLAADSTHYTGWAHLHPYYEYVIRHASLPNLDDTNGAASLGTVPDWMPITTGRNSINKDTGKKSVRKSNTLPGARLMCSIARSFVLNGGAEVKHSFAFSWNFPNLHAENLSHVATSGIVGHYYSNFFASAMEVTEYAVANRTMLYERSRQFQDDFFDSSIEVDVLEQINSHLNTFVTSGCLIKDGSFGILEGLSATQPWGPIATIDVMLYGTAPIIALFPELQKATMRRHAQVQSTEGEVAHGLLKSFTTGEDGTGGVSHRLDLPGQFVILILRDYFWTGDKAYLREMYPHIQRAIDYIAQHRSFAGDSIPIMRGVECSYDNFPMYGYASYLVSQWACALASAALAAEAMNDSASKARYEGMLKTTTQTLESKLWNGRYYRLYNDTDRAGGHGDVSEGSLTDQVIGQWLAHQSGLGSILPKAHVDAAMRSILSTNYRAGFGLKNCSWPADPYLSPIPRDMWGDQGNTYWSGVELAFASHLLYEGFRDEAVEVIRTVNQRYRNNGLYWDHQEFGGHYFRPMSSWAILNGYLGLGVNEGRLRFAPRTAGKACKLFFATTTGTGHYIDASGSGGSGSIRLRCAAGKLVFTRIEIMLAMVGRRVLSPSLRGTPLAHTLKSAEDRGGYSTWVFEQPVEVLAGDELLLR